MAWTRRAWPLGRERRTHNPYPQCTSMTVRAVLIGLLLALALATLGW